MFFRNRECNVDRKLIVTAERRPRDTHEKAAPRRFTSEAESGLPTGSDHLPGGRKGKMKKSRGDHGLRAGRQLRRGQAERTPRQGARADGVRAQGHNTPGSVPTKAAPRRARRGGRIGRPSVRSLARAARGRLGQVSLLRLVSAQLTISGPESGSAQGLDSARDALRVPCPSSGALSSFSLSSV